ncbi:aspartate/glutamate racemase family protein [Acuticoccus kandeliae]|uniref:aspartate/glutamate racemase family protein n=1 Tax=Acuticoccus kandeliae TaxID=2073160 RepID=UPI000D3EB91C|nr:aspartate/glutamate racemase family protein [Acuticoccus kandeliae]
MKILVVNPNTTELMTERMLDVATAVAAPGTELVGVTAARGVPYVASRAEAQLAGASVLELIAEHGEGVDAVIVAAFGDPGLQAARELFDVPVVGMAEAALLTACMLGDRFVLVTFSPTLTRWYADCVSLYGLDQRCGAIVVPDVGFATVEGVRSELRAPLVAAANEAVESGKGDVVILGGAPLTGLANQVKGELLAPVVDPISAAVVQAEALVRLGVCVTRQPTKPPGKPNSGLAPALARAIARKHAGG